MAELKSKPTGASVGEFLDGIEDERKRSGVAAARAAAAAVLALVTAMPAKATLVVDQQNDFDALEPVAGIGGPADQKVAQVVTAGQDGDLVEVHLPAGCQLGSMVLEIRDVAGDLPGSTILLRQTVSLPREAVPPVFRSIVLDTPLTMGRGDRFAIVLDSEDGVCATATSTLGDTYADGQAFSDAASPVRGWDPWTPERDIAFKTLVETGGPLPPRGRKCLQDMPDGPLPFPSHLPVCSCLEDRAARELRCGLFHPDFFLIRTVPFPIPPGQEFVVRWRLLPFEALGESLSLREILPQELPHEGEPAAVFEQGALAGQIHEFKYVLKAPYSSVLLPVATEIVFSGLGGSDEEPARLQSMWTVLPSDEQ